MEKVFDAVKYELRWEYCISLNEIAITGNKVWVQKSTPWVLFVEVLLMYAYSIRDALQKYYSTNLISNKY